MQSDTTASQELQTDTEIPEVETAPTATVARWTGGVTARKWAPLLARFTIVQAVVQVVGLTAGLLIVRALPKREYAFYTIANTMLATILELADSGISGALAAIGGRIWQNGRQLGSVLNTALQLRRQLAAITIFVVVPVLAWLLRENGASLLVIAALIAAVLVGSGLELVTRIYSVALRLRSEIRQIQKQAFMAALAKLAVVAAALFIFFNATVAIVAVVVGYAVQFEMLRRWVQREVDRSAPRDPAMRSEIVSVLKRQAPHSIYYCLQGQIMVWLISIFGNSDSVANVGALGRLALVFALLSSVTVEVVLPAFSRIQSLHQLRRRYFQIVVGYLGFAVLLVAVVALFPGQVLSVLGHQYSNLHAEGILMAACGVTTTTAGLLWATNAARAWVVPPALLIPCTLVLQAVLVVVLKLSTVRGVLLFGLWTCVPSILFSIGLAVTKMWGRGAAAIHPTCPAS